MATKVCTNPDCLKEKDESEFYRRGNGFRNQCKECEKPALSIRKKKDYRDNPDKIKNRNKNWRKNNPEKTKEINDEWRKNNPYKIKDYDKKAKQKPSYKEKRNDGLRKRRQEDPFWKLRTNISHDIWKMLKNQKSYKGDKSFLEYLGKNYILLANRHIESQFEFWMNWNNWGIYNPKTHDTNPTWQLDHIIPKSLLEYKSMEDPLFQICWSLENLRPLDAKQNGLDGSTRIRHTQANKDLIKQKVKEITENWWNQMVNFFSYEI